MDKLSGMYLLADASKLSQVIRNLVSNAIKFTPVGGIVTISAYGKDDRGPVLCVTVKDTGVGIAKVNIEYLFERNTISH